MAMGGSASIVMPIRLSTCAQSTRCSVCSAERAAGSQRDVSSFRARGTSLCRRCRVRSLRRGMHPRRRTGIARAFGPPWTVP
jgi:hypothetical protein